ncbi:MAG: PAS domain S-box protein, partial [Nitrospinota bacterium]|nr:PAS domain S-box protein [Nitrospinota bacterium]
MAERRIDQSERKLRRVMDSAGEGIVLIDARGKVASVNSVAERLLGVGKPELVGSVWAEVLAGLGGKKAAEAVSSARAVDHKIQIERRDGSQAGLVMNFSQIYELNNSKAGAVCVLRQAVPEGDEALAEARIDTHYQDFFDNASIGMGKTGLDFRFLEVNDTLVSMFGYSREELIGMKPLDLTYPDDVAPNQDLQDRASVGEIDSYRMEKRYIRKDGSVFWGIMSAAPVKGADGAVLYFLGQIQDITKLKNAEAALKESEERYRQLVESSPIPIFVHSDFKIRYINPAAIAVLGGASADEFIGANPLSLSTEKEQDFAKERILEIYERKSTTRVSETKFIRVDGRMIDVEIMGAPLVFQGKAGAQTIFQDVTERKAAERALIESTKEWAYAMDFFEDAICLLDMDLRVKRANSAFYMMTELTPEKVIGNKIQRIFCHHTETDCPMCVALNDKYDEIITMEADHSANPAGRPIEVMIKMVRDETRKPASILMAIHYLTRQRTYEDALRESEEKYRTLIDQVNEGIIVAQDEVIKLANEAM